MVFFHRLRRPAGRMTVEEQHLEGEYRYVNSRLLTNRYSDEYSIVYEFLSSYFIDFHVKFRFHGLMRCLRLVLFSCEQIGRIENHFKTGKTWLSEMATFLALLIRIASDKCSSKLCWDYCNPFLHNI